MATFSPDLKTPSLAGKTVGTLRAFPWHFLILQIPEASIDILDKCLASYLEKNPWMALVSILPYFVVASALSSALTSASLFALEKGEKPSLAGSVRYLHGKWARLMLASFLAGSVILLGLPLLFPAVYFMSVYLFVPQLVTQEAPLPTFAYLSRSKNLVRPVILKTVSLMAAVLAVGFLLYLLDEALRSLTKGSFSGALVAWGVNIFLSLITSATINIGVTYFFLKQRAVQSEKHF